MSLLLLVLGVFMLATGNVAVGAILVALAVILGVRVRIEKKSPPNSR